MGEAAAVREGQVIKSLTILSQEVSVLHDNVLALSERLKPVLSPSKVQEKEELAPAPDLPPLANALEKITAVAYNTRIMVQEMIERLEV